MIKAFTITILSLFFYSTAFAQVGGTGQLRDSLKHELVTAKNDTSRSLLMSELAKAYFGLSIDTVYLYANEALELAQQIHYSRGEASALTAFGGGFQLQGDYPKSLEYLYRALKIAEEKKFIFEAAVCYSLIGNTYWFLADYKKTVDFVEKSQNLFKTINNSQGVSEWMRFNILLLGQGYLEFQLDSSYVYLFQFHKETLNDKFWHPVALYNLGDCLFRRGDRGPALNYLREGIAGARVNDDILSEAEACSVMSGFYNSTHEPDSAIYYANKGLEAARSIAYGLGIYKNSKILAEVYEQSNVKEALHYRKIYDSINENMYGAGKVQDLQKTLAEEQHRQQQIQQEQTEKENRLKQYGFIAGLAILLLVTFILYRNNLQKKNANILLQRQKEKVESTLAELKATQAQLIQSEKMASLGELTAGIAHEIQNPLNFVNNFSEVNAELITELKAESEKPKAEWDESLIKETLENLSDNEQKIVYHGKRAADIVKGMLQHSRSSSGVKEPTNINALADEYLRLAYHGLRAKDKSFNAILNTDYDPAIGAINIVPQDIGRVILNLINNAFYAVAEKKKQVGDGFEPMVSVNTKMSGDTVLISVKDNGNGIPDSIKEKIFQPFFTTKPTGQGTGLGLSLSYDIVKAHGGVLKLESIEVKGSAFLISLPHKNA